jgi:malonyl-CoA O-methyltransferase
MSEAKRLRMRRMRRNFARAAPRYESFAVLSREVLGRMIERLALTKIVPRAVLDLGSGTGMAARALAERYRNADILALDISLPMLQRQSARSPWQRGWRALSGSGRHNRVCADFEHLPLRAERFDLVVSNLALHWSEAASSVFAEASRVLRTGGLFFFTTFGPDTLKELAQASADAAGKTPVHAFMDMHDLGDALVGSGFADPVMEMEQLTLTYGGFDGLLRDLKGTGGLSTRSSSGLRTPRWRARLAERYERSRREMRLPATFELIYGHAWKAPARPAADADGVAVIQFHPRRRAM